MISGRLQSDEHGVGVNLDVGFHRESFPEQIKKISIHRGGGGLANFVVLANSKLTGFTAVSYFFTLTRDEPYFFQIFEAMEEAGARLGLPRDTARRLALQTGFGAASMALASDESPAQLKQNVMSPNGSTEQAIFSFQASGLAEIFEKAMVACANRAHEMQTEFSS